MNAANDALARGDHAAATAEFQKLAEQGDMKAQAHLGYMYYVGEGVEQDYTQAVKWYKKAAILGDKDSQYNLAVAHAFGEGTKQDYKESFHWYRRAAEQNHVVAQYSLGISYAYGEGIAQDPKLAAEWFQKSADQGYERAQVILGSLYHTGDGVEKDYEKAAFWYRKAADKGNAAAQYNLGTLYRAGNGVGQNYNQAVRWFRLSADQGYAAAQNELASIERAVAGANRSAPVSVPEIETTPVESVATEPVTTIVEDGLPKKSPQQETTVAETPVKVAEPETIESNTPDETEEITEVEKPKRGFFSKLFGKKDVEPEQSGVVYATAEEVAADESRRIQVAKTEIASEEIVSPKTEPKISTPEAVAIEEVAEPETIESNTPDETEEITEVEKPKRGFFSKLFGKKDVEPEQSGVVYATAEEVAADESRRIQVAKTEIASEEIVSPKTEPKISTPEAVAIEEVAEPETIESNTPDETEEITEVEKPKRGFFSKLFGKKDDSQKQQEDLVAPEEDNAVQREPEETFIDTIETTPNLENTGSASELQPQAVRGDSKAQFQLGSLYYRGKGVKKDYSQAFLWYRRAAQQGEADAQYSLGNMYLMGEGIKQDDYQARLWYEKAANQGHEGAQRNFGSLQRIATAEPIEKGDYDTKNNSLPKQDETAIQEKILEEETAEKKGFFSKLFGKDDDEADESGLTSEAIEKTETGNGQIKTETMEAARDIAASIYETGLTYEFGEGVAQNYDTAFEFFKKSAEQNYAPAQYKLGLSYAYGQGTEKDPVTAAAWYKKSASQDYALAQRTLGALYISGDGVEQNKSLALAWYDLLADGGNVMDVHRRDSLREKLTTEEIDEANKLKQDLSN